MIYYNIVYGKTLKAFLPRSFNGLAYDSFIRAFRLLLRGAAGSPSQPTMTAEDVSRQVFQACSIELAQDVEELIRTEAPNHFQRLSKLNI